MLKKILLAVTALLLVAIALFYSSKSLTWQSFGKIVNRVDTKQKIVALTFDDGPVPGATEALLTLLDTHRVKASFFLVGKAMERHPEQVKMIADAGHDIGNHSYTHSRMVFFSYPRVADEIDKTSALIRQAGYAGSILFRPPYGKKLFNLPRYLADQKITTVTWDVAPERFDGTAEDPIRIRDAVIQQVRPGSIVLLHPMRANRAAVLAALPEIIAELRRRGFYFVTLSQLLTIEGSTQAE